MKTIHTITTKFYGASVNCFLVKTDDDGYILFDTGGKKARAELETALREAGCTPDNRRLRLIALTHGHFDHADNARYLREKYGAQIAMHPDDVTMVERGNMFWHKGALTNIGINSIMTLMGMGKFETFTPDILLREGDTLREFGLDATVYHLPGHSRGSIGFLFTDGDYITGDVFTNLKGKLKMNGLVDEKSALITSTERIKASGAKRVYVGHGDCFALPIGG